MDEKRKEEIVIAFIKEQARLEGIRLAALKRELDNVAQRTGIPVAELEELLNAVIGKIVKEHLGK